MELAGLYDQPPVVARFVGGPKDGETWVLPDGPDEPRSVLLVPVPAEPVVLTAEKFPLVPVMAACDQYRFRGIADDGARLYQHAGRW